MNEITARCFVRLRDEHEEKPSKRRGVWIMTRYTGSRGMFFHGDREETQAPRYTIEELSKWSVEGNGFIPVKEITPQELLDELASWPEGKRAATSILKRHGAEVPA